MMVSELTTKQLRDDYGIVICIGFMPHSQTYNWTIKGKWNPETKGLLAARQYVKFETYEDAEDDALNYAYAMIGIGVYQAASKNGYFNQPSA